MKPIANSEPTPAHQPPSDWIEVVRRHVASLRHGGVQVTVHGGKVVQVARTERFRFESSGTPPAPGEVPQARQPSAPRPRLTFPIES